MFPRIYDNINVEAKKVFPVHILSEKYINKSKKLQLDDYYRGFESTQELQDIYRQINDMANAEIDVNKYIQHQLSNDNKIILGGIYLYFISR